MFVVLTTVHSKEQMKSFDKCMAQSRFRATFWRAIVMIVQKET